MCTRSSQHEVLTSAEWIGAYWPAPATLPQHLTEIGSVSACTRRQQYALPDQRAIECSLANTGR